MKRLISITNDNKFYLVLSYGSSDTMRNSFMSSQHIAKQLDINYTEFEQCLKMYNARFYSANGQHFHYFNNKEDMRKFVDQINILSALAQ